ncbi:MULTISPECIES: YcdB/YcdC domain-containing protein [unclassified Paenibacillus]|uniref:YcdB/YcdC domain-containing protein n=1 Tax=unclassified Paenibacillus TaxID=185978 RepID=UPI001AE15FBF|nr:MULTISPECIES: YcdB/YcdC domain-containing protein [unclassified Paenibacillus]MBP1154178.1 Zn-dependent metalloprotease [Paenibacillus sp. PvP091]MBP1170437.1 Zn-dependent metalloprotease [Paenibacillus sp. PvR098]MBP2441465.1 Zn-dependent metalloprotease [Paenibacillus sp. PvP052]
MMNERPNPGRFKGRLAILSVLSLSLLPLTAHANEIRVGINATAASASGFTSSSGSDSSASMEAKPVKAEAKITKDEAVAIVKNLFPKLKLKDAQAVRVELGDNHSYPPQYQNVWTISWQVTSGNSSHGFDSKVDSMTGDLLQTHLYFPMDESNEAYYPPKVSKEEALELAKAFIQKASPTLSLNSLKPMDQSRYSNQALFGPVQYDFSFTALVHGIASPGGHISVSINGNGEITGYNRNVVTADYPSPDPAIASDEAAKKFEPVRDLSLQYVPVYQPFSRDKSWFLGWVQPFHADLSIDAQTDEFLNYTGAVVQPEHFQYKDVQKTNKSFTVTTGNGDNQLLTEEQAIELVERMVSIPDNRTRSMHSLDTYWGDQNKKVWNISWREDAPTGPYGGHTNAVVDARTGQILEFREDRMVPPWMNPKPDIAKTPNAAITQKEAEEKALALINELYPNASEELKWFSSDPYAPPGGDEQTFGFRFQRFFKGIPVGGDTVSMVLNSQGQLSGYHSVRSDRIEEAAGSLKANTTKAQAAAVFLEGTSQELQYKSFGGYYTESQYVEPRIKLVYQQTYKDSTKNGYVIDAANGQWRATFLDHTSPGEGPGEMPVDITGHWAQKDLETMLRYSILAADSNGQLHPDKAITLGDWLLMLSQAVNPHYTNSYSYNNRDSKPEFEDVSEQSPYYAAAQFFIQSKWLDPKKTPQLRPDEALTKEKLAVLLTQMIKYNKLAAQLQQNPQLNFEDSERITEKGAVWLITRLGLLDGSVPEFNPRGEVTKAQAATVLMRLVHLQGKLDQRIAM